MKSPVSSLLGKPTCGAFADRFPVIEQSVNATDSRAQVILGADDKHLRFRSCVGVEILSDGRVALTMGTRVVFGNSFGRFYMAAIDKVHRSYVSPTMLRMAVEHVVMKASKSFANPNAADRIESWIPFRGSAKTA